MIAGAVEPTGFVPGVVEVETVAAVLAGGVEVAKAVEEVAGAAAVDWTICGVFSVVAFVVSAEPQAEESAIDVSAIPPMTIPASLRKSRRDSLELSVLSVPTSFTSRIITL